LRILSLALLTTAAILGPFLHEYRWAFEALLGSYLLNYYLDVVRLRREILGR
jgi:hypothetical protein